MQIDVIEVQVSVVHCNLYTGERCVQMVIGRHDYENLIKDGFFIRSGKEKDSANVINTTKDYK